MKRTPLQRKSPMRRTRAEGPTAAREAKPRSKAETREEPAAKPCAYCHRDFVPARPMQAVCGPVCAGRIVKKQAAERKAKLRAEEKAHRDQVIRLPDLLAEAQKAFNDWIRARDAMQPCISCGAQPPDETRLHAGRDAGHYRSVGAAGALRFHEDNCHSQCVHCNQFGAGRAADYRIGLVARIGLARVEALECANAVRKWDREQVAGTRDTYRARLRALKKERGTA